MATSEIYGTIWCSDLEIRYETTVSTSALQSTDTWKAQMSYFFDCDITVQVIKLLTPDRSFIYRANAKHMLTPIAVIKSIIKPTTKSAQHNHLHASFKPIKSPRLKIKQSRHFVNQVVHFKSDSVRCSQDLKSSGLPWQERSIITVLECQDQANIYCSSFGHIDYDSRSMTALTDHCKYRP